MKRYSIVHPSKGQSSESLISIEDYDTLEEAEKHVSEVNEEDGEEYWQIRDNDE